MISHRALLIDYEQRLRSGDFLGAFAVKTPREFNAYTRLVEEQKLPDVTPADIPFAQRARQTLFDLTKDGTLRPAFVLEELCHKLNAELSDAKREIELLQVSLAIAPGLKTAVEADLESANVKIGELERSLEQVSGRVHTLADEKRLASKEAADDRKELIQAQADLRHKTTEAEKAQKNYEAANDQVQGLRARLETAGRELAAARQEKGEARRSVFQASSRLQMLSSRLAQSSKITAGQKEVIRKLKETAQAELKKARDAQAEAERKLRDLQQEHSAQARQLERALEQKRQMEELMGAEKFREAFNLLTETRAIRAQIEQAKGLMEDEAFQKAWALLEEQRTIKTETEVARAEIERAVATLPALDAVAPDLKSWVVWILGKIPVTDNNQTTLQMQLKQAASLILAILALPVSERLELDRHLARIKGQGSQALESTNNLYTDFSRLSAEEQAEAVRYIKMLLHIRKLGAEGRVKAFKVYTAIIAMLPNIASLDWETIIQGIAPETLPQTITFLSYSAKDRKYTMAHNEKMHGLTRDAILAAGLELRDQLRLLAEPITDEVRLEVIEEYLGRSATRAGAKTMAKINDFRKDPDPLVRDGANLVYFEKELRGDLVRLTEAKDQIVLAGIINRYINLEDQNAALCRIRDLRKHSDPTLKKGAEQLYYLWVRNMVFNLASLQDSKTYQDRLFEMSQINGILRDTLAIANNNNENQLIENSSVTVKDAAFRISQQIEQMTREK